MTAMLVLLFAIPLTYSLIISNSRSLGVYRDSTLNPMLLIAAYCVISAGDFLSFTLIGSGELAQRTIYASPRTLNIAIFKHVAVLTAICVGLGAGFAARQRQTPVDPRAERVQGVTLILMVVVLAGWTYFQFREVGLGDLSFRTAVDVKVLTERSTPLFVFSILMLPAFSYFLYRRKLKIALGFFLAILFATILSGSRTRVLYCIVPFIFYIHAVLGWRLRRRLFPLAILAAGVLALLSINYRYAVSQSHGFDSVGQLLTINNVFNINDIPFAEVNVILEDHSNEKFADYFGEGIVGFALAAVPRGIAPIKPDNGSVQFTRRFDPANWRDYRRGLTIGGVNDLLADYRLVVAVIVAFLFGWGWAFGFARMAMAPTATGFGFTIGFYLSLYAFLKADLQSAGQVLWATSIYYLIMKGCVWGSSQITAFNRPTPPVHRRPSAARPASRSPRYRT